jgi:ABC-2 type transport system permease protein
MYTALAASISSCEPTTSACTSAPLSGVLLPLSIAPGCIEALAHLNSLFYAVTAARDLSEGEIFTADVGLAFVVIGALTLAWATRLYRHAIA